VQIIEAEDGYVADYTVEQGNPSDTAALIPALDLHKRRFGQDPAVVVTDRGYDWRENQEAYQARQINQDGGDSQAG
jgi:hypothetical protein